MEEAACREAFRAGRYQDCLDAARRAMEGPMAHSEASRETIRLVALFSRFILWRDACRAAEKEGREAPPEPGFSL